MKSILALISKILALVSWMDFGGLALAGPVPSVPRDLLVAPGDNQVSVRWRAVTGATSYNVKRANIGSLPTNVVSGLATTDFVDTSVTNGRSYFYAVSAVNSTGESVTSALLSATPSAAVLDVLPAGAKLERLATGFGFVEGPVWIPTEGGYVVFSDINNNRLQQWKPGVGASVFRQRSNGANGNTLDRQGRLITCEQQTRRISRAETNNALTTLVDRYNGKAFNAPNDVVVKSDGMIWFTDPDYGAGQTQPGRYVYRFDPTNGNQTVTTVVTNFDQPNGLCFSPDEKKLYIGDSGGPHHIRVFDVLPNNTLTNSRVFAVINPGVPDGMRCDATGRLFSSAGDGVQIFNTNGALLGKLLTRETAANVCFGGSKNEMLFITAQSSLYGITRMPDLVVTGVTRTPANPVNGQAVLFSAIVKNQGTGPTPAGTAIRVAFTIGTTTNIVWSDGFEAALPPDASVVLTCNGGVRGAAWIAVAGTHSVRARVDDVDRLTEINENNNTYTTAIDVAPLAPDSDGDGLDDPSETIAGTDPQNAASVLKIISNRPASPDRVVITWTAVPGKKYRVVCKASLTDSDWLGLSEIIDASGPFVSWTNRLNGPLEQIFYRVQVEP